MYRKLFVILSLLFLMPIRAFALQQGSIEVAMEYGGKTVSGGTVTLYEIGDWSETADAEILAEYADKMNIPGTTKKVGEDGKARFPKLAPGHYLVVQHEAPAGFLPMNPFCISIPMTVGGKLIYDVQATPKLQRLPEPQLPQTGQLIWPIWVLLGSGFGLIGLGYLLQKRK